ncbi:hypothetical protein CWI26_08230 [Streptococcus suis]|nr:hypothetical protein CWI26_08230 [Streptococcus suis]
MKKIGSGTELESDGVRLPTPAQLIRSDLEYVIRTNLPINHCAEMLTYNKNSAVILFHCVSLLFSPCFLNALGIIIEIY